jgi:exopolyphosphatase/guanosine-5'-triphosphate,3'-diphosphate pyrophosphatase
MLNPSDPITDVQIESLQNYLKTELQPLFDAVNKFPVTELVGSSGSFDSLADMISARFYAGSVLSGEKEYTFNLNDVIAIHELIVKSTTAERMKMQGLIEMRVDMIVVSSILLNFIIQSFAIQKMRLSTYSLKEGVMQENLMC